MKKLIFGITGNIGVGKTYMCEKLEFLAGETIDFHLLNIDEIRRNILLYSENQEDVLLRKLLVKKLNIENYSENYTINGAVLGDIIFYDKNKMNIYREIINPRINHLLEVEIGKLEGIILLEWAMLVEDNMLDLVENNVILINCSEARKQQRLENTDMPIDQLQKRIDMQTPYENLVTMIKERQKIEGSGKLILVDTTDDPNDEFYINIFDKLQKYYGL